MNKKIDHRNIIDTNHLFWGSSIFQETIPQEKLMVLCDLEILDWLSSLYWGESLAMVYAQKMSEISPNKEKWLSVYRDEFKHQTILGNWFVENNLTPNPKNKIMSLLSSQIERMNSQMTEEKLIQTIYSTQVFFEELLHAFFKVRMKFVKDRSLKAIFFQIYSDEADHLGKARTEIVDMERKPKRLYEVLDENINRLFPFDLAKGILNNQELSFVKGKKDSIIVDMLKKARSGIDLYSPSETLCRFLKIPSYNCVACSPKRHNGLNLDPKFDNEACEVWDDYSFSKKTEGFSDIVHGGYVAMILDEMLGYAVIFSRNLLPLTKKMIVNYKLPVVIGITYKLKAKLISSDNQIFQCVSTISDSEGRVYAEATGTMFVPNEIQAKKILGDISISESVQGMFIPV